MTKTAVIILNWNGLEFLKKFLPSVVKYSLNNGTEICIADNGSTDGSAEWINLNFRDVRLIRLEKNFGFSDGYNRAIEQIDAQYYILLNSDIEVTPGWLEPLISCLDDNPDVASCQPKILSYNRKDHFEYAGAAGGFIDKYGYPLCRGRVITELEKDNGQYDTPADIFWSTGACMAVRSDAWKKCGGFDPEFFAHMEEIDLCWRFKSMGYRVVYNPESEVYHVGGGTLTKENPFKTYLNFRNNLYLLYKNMGPDSFRLILFKRLILDGIAAIRFALYFDFKCAFSVFKAHMDFYKSIKSTKIKRQNNLKLFKVFKHKEIYHKSIVFNYFLWQKRTFNQLTFL